MLHASLSGPLRRCFVQDTDMMEGGKENTQPGQESGLARMFREGNKAIGTHRTNDLFKQLESRSLTEDEQAIIQQRLDLQRKMLVAYETQERSRKVQDLLQVCPELTEEEAQRALELCNGREDVAVNQLLSDPSFKRRLQSIAATSAPATRTGSTQRRSAAWHAKPSARRPKQVDSATLGNSVFVGSFRGGKRGGSRTAHLKAAAASSESAPATSASSHEPAAITWGTSRAQRSSSSRRPAKHPAEMAENPRQAGAGADLPSEEEAQDTVANAQQANREQQQVVEEEEDEQISGTEGEEAEGSEDEEAAGLHEEESGELLFEADVVDALGTLPNSQPQRLEAGSHNSMDRQLTATGVQAPSKPQSSSTQNVDSALPMSPDRGVRHSRRLAALSEAQPSTAAAQPASAHHSTSQDVPHADGRRSSSLLQTATLEASANVLKGLTLSTGVKFLRKMQLEARQGTLAALQVLDAAKAELLEAQLHDNSPATNQQADVAASADKQLLAHLDGPASANLPYHGTATGQAPSALQTKQAASQQAAASTLRGAGADMSTRTDAHHTADDSSPSAEPKQPESSAAVAAGTGKKRKADRVDDSAAADKASATEAGETAASWKASAVQSVDDQSGNARGSGRARLNAKPKRGTLQAAFAKAKDGKSNEAKQSNKRTKHAVASSEHDRSALADANHQSSADQSADHAISGVDPQNLPDPACKHEQQQQQRDSSEALPESDVLPDQETQPDRQKERNASTSAEANHAAEESTGQDSDPVRKSKKKGVAAAKLPDQATKSVSQQRRGTTATESLPDVVDESSEHDAPAGKQKRNGRSKPLPQDSDQLPTQDAEPARQKRSGRSIRPKTLPDEVIVDAIISDSEHEEAETESDAEFVTRTKASKKRGRTAGNSPAKKQKTRKSSQAQSSAAVPGSPSSSAPSKQKKTAGQGGSVSPSPSSSPCQAVKERRSRRPSAAAREAEEAAEQAAAEAAAASPPSQAKGISEAKKAKALPRPQAIARSGHTNRGRVKQKSHKAANILEVGSVRPDKGWYNSGYIFPEGFKSQLPFRSSVELDQLCLHECTIIGQGGVYWPQPTYKVVAMDRADEPLIAKSCTGCWTQVLKRINSEIEARRKAGENLPPPPKTAIAGPEYFGLNQPELTEAIEALDPDHECSEYWHGKADREAAAAGLPPVERGPRPPRPSGGAGPRPKRSRKAREGSDEEAEMGRNEDEEDEESANMTNRWSAVSRTERYRKRCGDEGNNTVDETNPLPNLIDPITLEPVVTPAISPFGHVMGLATWKAVLAEQGKCPFTKNDLSWEQCTTLTFSNIDRYRDRIKAV